MEARLHAVGTCPGDAQAREGGGDAARDRRGSAFAWQGQRYGGAVSVLLSPAGSGVPVGRDTKSSTSVPLPPRGLTAPCADCAFNQPAGGRLRRRTETPARDETQEYRKPGPDLRAA